MLEFENVTRNYEHAGASVPALRNISLRIKQGEFIAIMGPSGSGKTTLMNLLGLLDRPDSGRYRIDGAETAALSADRLAALRNQRIGFVFQSFNLLPRSRAVENVELPLVYARVSRAERRRRALAALERVSLSHRADHWPQQLSGGEQQRVAIARAIVCDAKLLLADEPTGALDSRTGEHILALFQTLHRSGCTVVMVTHDRQVARHAERLVYLRDGRLVANRRNDEPLKALDASDQVPA